MKRLFAIAVALLASAAGAQMAGQMKTSAPRDPALAAGPYELLVIRGVTIIPGNGGPPYGPADIIINQGRITDIRSAGTPGLPMATNRPPAVTTAPGAVTGGQFAATARQIDATGMYVLPGFVDMHGHQGDIFKMNDPDYAWKLWLAHGVTTLRGIPLYGGDAARALADKKRAAAGEIMSPRIYVYQTLGSGANAGWKGGRVLTAKKAREWVRWAASAGIDGIKFFNRGDETPEIDRAAIDEAKKLGLGTVAHLSQTNIAEFNARDAAAAGLGTITHFYGHFESLLDGRRVQDTAPDYNFNDEQKRFGGIAEIWDQIHPPGSAEWVEYLKTQKKTGVNFDPTFNIYSASRDLMRAQRAEWHDRYTLPSLTRFFESNRDNHGSYFFEWTSEREYEWRRFYTRYMQLVNNYKNMGGRVTTGSDPGFIWQTWGFGYILELELLREAGFAPLEVIQAATINGARTLEEPKGREPDFGLIRVGMRADLIIVPENPLANLKTLYGTGFARLDEETQKTVVKGGIRWTIRDGIVHDVPAILKNVADQVAAAKAAP